MVGESIPYLPPSPLSLSPLHCSSSNVRGSAGVFGGLYQNNNASLPTDSADDIHGYKTVAAISTCASSSYHFGLTGITTTSTTTSTIVATTTTTAIPIPLTAPESGLSSHALQASPLSSSSSSASVSASPSKHSDYHRTAENGGEYSDLRNLSERRRHASSNDTYTDTGNSNLKEYQPTAAHSHQSLFAAIKQQLQKQQQPSKKKLANSQRSSSQGGVLDNSKSDAFLTEPMRKSHDSLDDRSRDNFLHSPSAVVGNIGHKHNFSSLRGHKSPIFDPEQKIQSDSVERDPQGKARAYFATSPGSSLDTGGGGGYENNNVFFKHVPYIRRIPGGTNDKTGSLSSERSSSTSSDERGNLSVPTVGHERSRRGSHGTCNHLFREQAGAGGKKSPIPNKPKKSPSPVRAALFKNIVNSSTESQSSKQSTSSKSGNKTSNTSASSSSTLKTSPQHQHIALQAQLSDSPTRKVISPDISPPLYTGRRKFSDTGLTPVPKRLLRDGNMRRGSLTDERTLVSAKSKLGRLRLQGRKSSSGDAGSVATLVKQIHNLWGDGDDEFDPSRHLRNLPYTLDDQALMDKQRDNKIQSSGKKDKDGKETSSGGGGSGGSSSTDKKRINKIICAGHTDSEEDNRHHQKQKCDKSGKLHNNSSCGDRDEMIQLAERSENATQSKSNSNFNNKCTGGTACANATSNCCGGSVCGGSGCGGNSSGSNSGAGICTNSEITTTDTNLGSSNNSVMVITKANNSPCISEFVAPVAQAASRQLVATAVSGVACLVGADANDTLMSLGSISATGTDTAANSNSNSCSHSCCSGISSGCACATGGTVNTSCNQTSGNLTSRLSPSSGKGWKGTATSTGVGGGGGGGSGGGGLAVESDCHCHCHHHCSSNSACATTIAPSLVTGSGGRASKRTATVQFQPIVSWDDNTVGDKSSPGRRSVLKQGARRHSSFAGFSDSCDNIATTSNDGGSCRGELSSTHAISSSPSPSSYYSTLNSTTAVTVTKQNKSALLPKSKTSDNYKSILKPTTDRSVTAGCGIDPDSGGVSSSSTSACACACVSLSSSADKKRAKSPSPKSKKGFDFISDSAANSSTTGVISGVCSNCSCGLGISNYNSSGDSSSGGGGGKPSEASTSLSLCLKATRSLSPKSKKTKTESSTLTTASGGSSSSSHRDSDYSAASSYSCSSVCATNHQQQLTPDREHHLTDSGHCSLDLPTKTVGVQATPRTIGKTSNTGTQTLDLSAGGVVDCDHSASPPESSGWLQRLAAKCMASVGGSRTSSTGSGTGGGTGSNSGLPRAASVRAEWLLGNKRMGSSPSSPVAPSSDASERFWVPNEVLARKRAQSLVPTVSKQESEEGEYSLLFLCYHLCVYH